MTQPGKGKADAVFAAFDAARGDVLMILDADLTVPPEQLPKFWHAIRSGSGRIHQRLETGLLDGGRSDEVLEPHCEQTVFDHLLLDIEPEVHRHPVWHESASGAPTFRG